jgi:superfamily II RNA helicase
MSDTKVLRAYEMTKQKMAYPRLDADSRIERLVEESRQKDARIAELEAERDRLQAMFDMINDSLPELSEEKMTDVTSRFFDTLEKELDPDLYMTVLEAIVSAWKKDRAAMEADDE